MDRSRKESGAQGNPPALTIEEVTKKCLDAPGYMMFTAVLTNKKDQRGAFMIDFHYNRSNFSFEDTRNAVEEFKKAYMADVDAG